MILKIVIVVGVVLAVVDVAMTVFWGRPLFKPGPLAKSMYPELTDDDEHGIL